MKCSNCGRENPSDARFCNNCGQPLAPAESADRREELLNRYVPASLRQKIQAAGSLEGQRRQVTILFCDVVGSTALAEKRDPEEAKIILEEALSVVMAQVSRYEGMVADLLGDGLLAFFGAPIAHEDDPERALRAALDIQEALSGYSEEIQSAYGVPLQVRVGIHTGTVVVGEMGSDLKMTYTAMGDAVNLASRMESQAPPGGILITEATHRLAERLFTFEPLGEIQVKGREQPVEAFLVTGLVKEPVRVRGIEGLYSPMVGRDQEQAQLMQAVENLVQGKGQIVTVMGEAGIGKTRLIQETREATSDKDILWLEGRALSYGQSLSLLLFQDLIRDFLGASEGESPSLIRVKLKSKTRALFGEREPEIYPYLASLLSLKLEGEMAERIADLHPEALKRRIFVVVGELLERLAQDQPVAVILEDLHWADPTSIELLKGLLPSTDKAPLMIVCAFRPERDAPWWQVIFEAQTQYPHRYREMTVEALPQEQSSRLVGSLLAVDQLPTGITSTILHKTAGNPFFLEEVVRALIDEGVLVRQEGEWRATSKVLSVEIPSTIQGVILSRIDGLEEGPRSTLQVASVLGNQFLYRILQRVSEVDGQLDTYLSVLQRSDLVSERTRFPELEYEFKHALIQEVAYEGLLSDRRRDFHRRAAQSIEELFPDRLEEFYGDLARHYEVARENEKALEYLLQAGDRARMAYAHDEAEAHYRRAIPLLEASNDQEELANTYLKLGLVYHLAGNFPQVAQSYERAFRLRPQTPAGPPTSQGEGETLHMVGFGLVGHDLEFEPGKFRWTPEGFLANHLFEGLGRYDAEGNVRPAAAAGWEVLEGGQRYVFHLRPGLTWSDGAAVTAQDFEFAWKRNLDAATGVPFPTFLFPIKGAEAFYAGDTSDPKTVGVKALDDLTLEVELERPTSYFPQLIAQPTAYPLPRHVVEKRGDSWTDPDAIVTNGPYLLEEFVPHTKVVLARNPRYSGSFLGNVGRVDWTDRSHPREVVAAYDKGEADVAHAGTYAPADIREAHPDEVRAFAALATWALHFIVSRDPVSDPRVRKAVAHAIDRRILAHYLAAPAADGGFVPPRMPGHSPEVNLRLDVERARELLVEAGYPNGDGIPPLELATLVPGQEVAEEIARQLRGNLGLDVVVRIEKASDFHRWADDAPHFYLGGWSADYPDPDNFLRTNFHSRSEMNDIRWRSESFDRLVDEASGLTDQAQRMALYREADALIVAEETVCIPLAYKPDTALVKRWVKGAWLNPMGGDLRHMIIERPR